MAKSSVFKDINSSLKKLRSSYDSYYASYELQFLNAKLNSYPFLSACVVSTLLTKLRTIQDKTLFRRALPPLTTPLTTQLLETALSKLTWTNQHPEAICDSFITITSKINHLHFSIQSVEDLNRLFFSLIYCFRDFLNKNLQKFSQEFYWDIHTTIHETLDGYALFCLTKEQQKLLLNATSQAYAQKIISTN